MVIRTISSRRKGGVMIRSLFALLVILVAAAVVFLSRRHDAAAEVKREFLAILQEIKLPEDWRTTAEQYVHAAHEKAFNKALDVTKAMGKKFDEKIYYDDLFDRIIAWAKEDGKTELADRLGIARKNYTFHVTER